MLRVPTAINNPLDVVEEESSDDLHDEIKVAILTTRTNQFNIHFIYPSFNLN